MFPQRTIYQKISSCDVVGYRRKEASGFLKQSRVSNPSSHSSVGESVVHIANWVNLAHDIVLCRGTNVRPRVFSLSPRPGLSQGRAEVNHSFYLALPALLVLHFVVLTLAVSGKLNTWTITRPLYCVMVVFFSCGKIICSQNALKTQILV